MNRVLFLILFLAGCSGLEKSEYETVKKKNATKEQVYRQSDSYLYSLQTPTAKDQERYPWEQKQIQSHKKK